MLSLHLCSKLEGWQWKQAKFAIVTKLSKWTPLPNHQLARDTDLFRLKPSSEKWIWHNFADVFQFTLKTSNPKYISMKLIDSIELKINRTMHAFSTLWHLPSVKDNTNSVLLTHSLTHLTWDSHLQLLTFQFKNAYYFLC